MKKSITVSTLIILFFLVTLPSCIYYRAFERENEREVRTKKELQEARQDNENQLRLRIKKQREVRLEELEKQIADIEENFLFRSPKPAQLQAELKRLQKEKFRSKTYTKHAITKPSPSVSSSLTSQDQAKAQYAWQNDIRYAKNSQDVYDFLQEFPGSKYEQEVRRKLEQLREQEGFKFERTVNFPWPPPHPSAYSVIPSTLLPNPPNKNYLKNIAKN